MGWLRSSYGGHLDTQKSIRREGRRTKTGEKTPENAGQIVLTEIAHYCSDFKIGGLDRWIGMVRGRTF